MSRMYLGWQEFGSGLQVPAGDGNRSPLEFLDGKWDRGEKLRGNLVDHKRVGHVYIVLWCIVIPETNFLFPTVLSHVCVVKSSWCVLLQPSFVASILMSLGQLFHFSPKLLKHQVNSWCWNLPKIPSPPPSCFSNPLRHCKKGNASAAVTITSTNQSRYTSWFCPKL